MDYIKDGIALAIVHEEGFSAKYYYGVSKFDCPYAENQVEYKHWMDGWEEANQFNDIDYST